MAAHVISKIGGDSLDVIKIRRALLSVSDKTGLVELGLMLQSHGVELLSTGGTAAALVHGQSTVSRSQGRFGQRRMVSPRRAVPGRARYNSLQRHIRTACVTMRLCWFC